MEECDFVRILARPVLSNAKRGPVAKAWDYRSPQGQKGPKQGRFTQIPSEVLRNSYGVILWLRQRTSKARLHLQGLPKDLFPHCPNGRTFVAYCTFMTQPLSAPVS